MSELIYGDRIGKTAALAPGATAVIFDRAREKVLLTRREDNGRWCLPGGGASMDLSIPSLVAFERMVA